MSRTELPVWDTLSAAWAKTYGSKATFWAAIGILAAIMFGIGILEGMTSKWWGIAGLFQLIGNILGYFLQLGLVYIGITRAKDLPINYKLMFTALDLQLALRLVGLYILETLIFLIPAALGIAGVFLFKSDSGAGMGFGALLFIISILASIFIGIRLSLCMAFVLDAGSAPVAAIKQSIAATEDNFWNLVAIFLMLVLLMFASLLTIGIGFIWFIPFAMIAYGEIFKTLRVNT